MGHSAIGHYSRREIMEYLRVAESEGMLTRKGDRKILRAALEHYDDFIALDYNIRQLRIIVPLTGAQIVRAYDLLLALDIYDK